MKKNIIIAAVFTLSLAMGCGMPARAEPWEYSNTIALEGINPIGIAVTDEGIWLSDGDRNRMVLVNREGDILRKIDSLERPMHIANAGNLLYVPLYGNDRIATVDGREVGSLQLADSLDAPAGIAVYGDQKAIADFYNHRILYYDGANWMSFGKKGKGDGEFNYPTDVQITEDFIWVADAYNNRIQVLNKEGGFVKTIGADQGMNAATGLFVTGEEVLITDFENNRILVFTREGELKQTLTREIDKPTDVLADGNLLLVLNYRNGRMIEYVKPE